MILAIHWLRAGSALLLFGSPGAPSLVGDYLNQSIGLRMLPYVLIAGSGHAISDLLTNVIGLLGGFGWEGVSALIIISGFSLTIADKSVRLNGYVWLRWLRKRAERILVPYYLVAVPFIILYFSIVAVVSHMSGSVARLLDAKLRSVFNTPPLGILLSHTLLFDPFSRWWQADFFAPAWWFIPGILLAYMIYPLILGAVKRKPATTLVLSGVITAVSYSIADRGLLSDTAWYSIVLQEVFNFTLGIVVGKAWLRQSSRAKLERGLSSWQVLVAAIVFFVLGNIANWYQEARPVASMLYGPGLVIVLGYLAKRCERTIVAKFATAADSYNLYLVHQPFAFPVALIAKAVFHSYAVFFGWFLYLSVSSVAAAGLSAVTANVMRPRSRSA